MLEQVDGKWVSTRTHAEELAAFQADLERLSPEEKSALQLMLAEAELQAPTATGSMVDAVAELEFDRLPVGPQQFLDDPYYLGEVAKNMFPKLREDFVKIFTGTYEELIATGSIGYGKSFFGTMCLAYVLYQLSCLRNPAESYGLAAGSQLHCVNLSARKDTAQRVIFEGLADKLILSPYFKETGFERRKDSLKFPKGIVVVGGESTDSSVLGLSVIAAIVDETNFLRTSAARKNMAKWQHFGRAEMLYSSIKSRMQSRFMKAGQLPGLLMLLSSRQVPDDFTETRIRQSIDDTKIYVMDYALWDVKPDNYSKDRFKVFVGSGGQKPKIMEPGEQIEIREDERIVEVPVDFKRRFEEDLTSSLRDLAGVSVVTVTNFIQNRETIFKAIDKTRQHPFSAEDWDPTTPGKFLWDKLAKKGPDGEMTPLHFPDAIRYIHIDPSISGDATGLAMGCVSGFRRVSREDSDGKKFEEDAPTIWVDLVMRIVPPQGGEIFLGDVRSLIYQLSERGFPISKVSMDSYQSVESLQQLKLKGYQTEIISVDAHLDPYQMLKGSMYEGRVSFYDFPVLITELKNLQLDWVRKKVDHQASGSKDVADALCGLVYSLTQKYTKKGGGTPYGAAPMQGISEHQKEETYVPIDSKSSKRGQILWPDEYEEQMMEKEAAEEKDKDFDGGDDGQMPPFWVG
jgi:hypothetical protein